jgi:hypothetical protein
MLGKNRLSVVGSSVLVCAIVFSAAAPGAGAGSVKTYYSDPISVSAGGTLRATVAVVPKLSHPKQGAAYVSIEAFDADGTDLAPIVEMDEVRIPAGRSAHLDVPFGSAATRSGGQAVILRASVRRERPGALAAVRGSVQTIQTQNQLWGDWFIIEEGRSPSAKISAPITGTHGDRLRATVAVVPASSSARGGAALVSIEAFDADGTDLPPIAELPPTRVPAGRSVHLDLPFRPAGSAGGQQGVILRARARPEKPGAVLEIRSSIEKTVDNVPSATLLIPYFSVP